MKPIKLRMNFVRSQEPYRDAYLLDDGRHVMTAINGEMFLLAVVPSVYPDLYAQDSEPIFLGKVSRDCDLDVMRDLYERMLRISAYALFTEYDRDKAGSNGFMLINEPDDESPPESPFHEYGRR
ncbi:hypothetical protein [Paenibacillus sp. SI8]|uniref:hypothetical protein n=1 Tax=unclassified Paenibacillus TaxID=185978 RepID=UPI0034674A27